LALAAEADLLLLLLLLLPELLFLLEDLTTSPDTAAADKFIHVSEQHTPQSSLIFEMLRCGLCCCMPPDHGMLAIL
jgi:hypothetical protein